jgi:hypothetical protein
MRNKKKFGIIPDKELTESGVISRGMKRLYSTILLGFVTFAVVLLLASEVFCQVGSSTGGASPLVPSLSAPNAPVSAKLLRYARRIVSNYDRDGDERLSAAEMEAMRGNPQAADLNSDGVLEISEFAQYVANYGKRRKIRLLFLSEEEEGIGGPVILNPATLAEEDGAIPPDSSTPISEESFFQRQEDTSEAAEGKRFHVRRPRGSLPSWFHARDADGDGQVSMAEYAPNATKTEIAEFQGMDKDGDGYITPRELLGPRVSESRRRSAARTAISPSPPEEGEAERSEADASPESETDDGDNPDSPASGSDRSGADGQSAPSRDSSAERRRGSGRREGRSRQRE